MMMHLSGGQETHRLEKIQTLTHMLSTSQASTLKHTPRETETLTTGIEMTILRSREICKDLDQIQNSRQVEAEDTIISSIKPTLEIKLQIDHNFTKVIILIRLCKAETLELLEIV